MFWDYLNKDKTCGNSLNFYNFGYFVVVIVKGDTTRKKGPNFIRSSFQKSAATEYNLAFP